jgi:hypothetical protein
MKTLRDRIKLYVDFLKDRRTDNEENVRNAESEYTRGLYDGYVGMIELVIDKLNEILKTTGE